MIGFIQYLIKLIFIQCLISPNLNNFLLIIKWEIKKNMIQLLILHQMADKNLKTIRYLPYLFFTLKFLTQYQLQMLREELDIIGPLLCVKDQPKNGLKIQWNFHGLMSEKKYQTFHTFLFIGMDLRDCQSLLNIYYQKLKLGEIMGIVKIKPSSKNSKDVKASIKWTQKTTFNLEGGFMNNNYICSTRGDLLQLLLPCIAKQNGLIAINILCNQPHSVNNIKQKAKQIRHFHPESDKIVFNIISKGPQKYQSLNHQHGIQFIPFLKENLEETVSKIHKIFKGLVLKKVKLRIYLNSHDIFKLFQNTGWKLTEVPNLQRVFYGIQSSNFNEYLVFLVEQRDDSKKIELKIILDISFYDGRKIRATRQLSVAKNLNDEYYQWYQRSYRPLKELHDEQLEEANKSKKIKSCSNQTIVFLYETQK